MSSSENITAECLGRAVQEAWRTCASKMPNPPEKWLRTYDEVSPEMQEIDRFIGKQILNTILHTVHLRNEPWDPDVVAERIWKLIESQVMEASWRTKYDQTS